MKTFLNEVTDQIYKEHQSFEDVVFVLPSKRAGIFLKQHIASHIDKPVFSPEIYSIEELIALREKQKEDARRAIENASKSKSKKE